MGTTSEKKKNRKPSMGPRSKKKGCGAGVNFTYFGFKIFQNQ